MNDFWLYLKLGVNHVLDWRAYDHVLFLVALVAAYNFNHWKRILILVTLFTLGHTASLILASYDIVSVSTNMVEFLIPLTILVAALYNLLMSGKGDRKKKLWIYYIITVFFGLIHGFGFATYFKMVNDEGSFLPLLEFALGIELAQIIVVLIVMIAGFIGQALFRFNLRDWVLVISSIVMGMVIPMLINNWPF
jgi:hypothetical protein